MRGNDSFFIIFQLVILFSILFAVSTAGPHWK